MHDEINWFELRARLQAAGVPHIFRLSKAELLERAKALPAARGAAKNAALTLAAQPSPGFEAIAALIARGVRKGNQIITRLDDGSGLLICRRDIGAHAHRIEAGGAKVDHWNIEVHRAEPHSPGRFKRVLDLHVIVGEHGEVIDAHF